jgi:hypothetical protein
VKCTENLTADSRLYDRKQKTAQVVYGCQLRLWTRKENSSELKPERSKRFLEKLDELLTDNGESPGVQYYALDWPHIHVTSTSWRCEWKVESGWFRVRVHAMCAVCCCKALLLRLSEESCMSELVQLNLTSSCKSRKSYCFSTSDLEWLRTVSQICFQFPELSANDASNVL